MADIDLKKLEVAIKYIERMADGKNPVNNQAIEADTIVNDPNVIRCFFFVSDILKNVYEREVRAVRKKVKKEKFPFEVLKNYKYKQDKPISHVMRQINDLVKDEKFEKLNYNRVTKWLKLSGYLMEEHSEELNKKVTLPTQRGKEIGMYYEKREGSRGEQYFTILYNEKAQYFLIEHLTVIYAEVTAD